MNQEDLARCHCIISHPSKPKFLAIRLSDGSWAVPWVNYPAEGFMSDKAKMISDGFLEHYGLQTTVLRHLFDTREHHCVELEVHSRKGNKNLNAIWVGSGEYRPMGTFPRVPDDPFAIWLKEKDKELVSENRLAWEQQGWFRQASSWIHHQLDRLSIQMTGSVQQLRAGWYSSSLLRVNTSQGYCYFKAALDVEPMEAALTAALARKWPQWVPEPLAVDVRKNWMLSRSYGAPAFNRDGLEHLAVAARSLAELQIDSSQDLGELEKLGCRSFSLVRMSAFLTGIDGIFPLLSQGRTGLSDEELRKLESAAGLMQQQCEELVSFNIPDMLVHDDFHPRNLYRHEGGFWITDWANAMISHPFLSAARLVDPSGQWASIDERQKLAAAYAEPFGIYGPTKPFEDALMMAVNLASVSQLQRMLELLPRLEQGSISSRRGKAIMHTVCRKMISQAQATA